MLMCVAVSISFAHGQTNETSGVAVLAERLGDSDPAVRRAVAEIFKDNPKLILELDAAAALTHMAANDIDDSARLEAASALAELEPPSEAPAALVEAGPEPSKKLDGSLESVFSHLENQALHPAVARVIEDAGEAGADALAAALSDDDPLKRTMAARVVLLLTKPPPVLLEALKQRLREEDRQDVWAQILHVLETFESLSLDEVSKLIQAESNPDFRVFLVGILPRFGSGAVLVLTESLRDRSTKVKLRALEGLTALGTASRSAAASIIAQSDTALADAVGEALAAIGPKALPEVLEASKSPVETQKKSAVIALGAYAAEEPAALTELIGLLETADRDLKEHVIRSLGRAGEAAASAVPALIRIMGSRDQWLELTAIETLGDIGKGAVPAVRNIISTLRSTASKELKHTCVRSLGRLAPYSDEAAAEVIRTAQGDPSPALRIQAIEALGATKFGGQDAANTLRLLLKEQSPALRKKAAEALLRVGAADDIAPAFNALRGAPSQQRGGRKTFPASPDATLTSPGEKQH